MNIRQYLLLSAVFAVGGCASSSKPSVAVDQSKPVVDGNDEPKWDPTRTPLPDSIRQKTNAYGNALATSDPEAGEKQTQEQKSEAQFLEPIGRHKKKQPAPVITDAAPAADPTAVAPTAPLPAPKTEISPAQLATAKLSATGNGLGASPKEVPLSEDFPSSEGSETLDYKLHKRARDNPNDVANQLDVELLQMLNDEPPAELAAKNKLTDDDNELVNSLVDGLRNFRSTVQQDHKMLQADKMKPLLEMVDRLKMEAGLSVTNLTLCRNVGSFGTYEPISPPEFFHGGGKNKAIVYCEVQNFLPRQNFAGQWETKLSEQVTLYNESGLPVCTSPVKLVVDECRVFRHDFFVYVILSLPASLPVGKYTLNATIEDQNAGHMDEAKLPLWIVEKKLN